MLRALKRVVANKESHGVDGMGINMIADTRTGCNVFN
jgi:hypothetical protein